VAKKTQFSEPLFWGLPLTKWREITAFCLGSLSLILFLSLLSENLGRLWMGAFGDGIAQGAAFVLGRWAAYVLPALLLLASIHAFRGRIPFHPLRKLVAGTLILLSVCGLLALPPVLGVVVSTDTFFEGGLLGNFLVSSPGLNLAFLLGRVGAYVIFSAAFLLGVMLSTDFLFVPLIQRFMAGGRALWGKLRPRKPVAVLSFGRESGGHAHRVFPLLAPRSGAGETSAGALLEMPGEPRASSKEPGEEMEQPDFLSQTLSEPAKVEEPGKKAGKSTSTHPGILQTELDFTSHPYVPPPLDLLSPSPGPVQSMDREEVLQTSGALEKALADFNISARVVAVTQGPVVTQYELQPAPGVKVSRIISLENDIALILRARSVRIQAPIPGKAAIGVEVPNRKVNPVYFRDLIDSSDFINHPSPLAFVLGRNISGEPVICDLAIMPHLLIAGTTGSGKSVCVNSIISSMLYRMPPDRIKFIMVDPKRVELNVYSDIPHLLAPVVNEPRQAAAALLWAVQQMEERLRVFSEMRVRNIDGYNAVVTGKRLSSRGVEIANRSYLPHIVIVIDELADLMLIAKNEVEDFVVRLAQMSRAAGIHLIIATQRPSVNVLTGIIKANFPSRIAFRVSAKVDSRTILDMNGAETLLGRGDMLFSPGGTKPMRIQGAFVSDADVERLADYVRAQVPAVYEKQDFASTLPEPLPGEEARLESGIVKPEVRSEEDEVDEVDEMDEVHEEEEKEETDDTGPARGSARPRQSMPGPPFPSRIPSGQVEFPSLQLRGDTEEDEVLYDRALRMVLESRKPSVSMIQRRLKLGFARAGRLMDLMEERGIVGPYLGSKPRDLIIDDPDGLLRRLSEIEREGGRQSRPDSF
jgi:DNA segregation ATPase FtsK/SpoIIIE-like protein